MLKAVVGSDCPVLERVPFSLGLLDLGAGFGGWSSPRGKLLGCLAPTGADVLCLEGDVGAEAACRPVAGGALCRFGDCDEARPPSGQQIQQNCVLR